MNVLVTGSNGFVGKNLIAALKSSKQYEVFEVNRDTSIESLDEYCQKVDFVFHLAGVNRPENEKEFMEGNYDFTNKILHLLQQHKNTCPVMISSSTQADLDNAYGKSKKAGEDLVFRYADESGAKVLVYRFPNIFGKWSKPNYNSAVATFCYNIAHGLPIQVSNPNVELNLVYIDDVITELMNALRGQESKDGEFCKVSIVHTRKLQEIVDLIESFKESRQNKSIPKMNDPFTKMLYSTYLSFLPEDQFKYSLKMNVDDRGSFTEFIKTIDRGQVSVNVSKPGITKGNHWHHTKHEKFLVVSGKGVIRFRKVDSDKVVEYFVSGEKLEVVDIPVGYTHNIENLGDTDMVTIMWANEQLDPDNPDTFHLEV